MHYNNMKIYQTINIGLEFKNVEKEIKLLDDYQIYGIRFNLCKYSYEELLVACYKILNTIKKFDSRYHFIFDLPYPQNKSRINGFTIVGGEIVEGNRYKIANKAYTKSYRDVIFTDPNTIFNISKGILYYGDGEGAFKVIDYNEQCINVEALNTFQIHLQKSITCGRVSNEEKCYNAVEEIVRSELNMAPLFLLSFVEEETQILRFRKNITSNQKYGIISKIENVYEPEKIERIIKSSDGALLARGDMALLNPITKIIDICRNTSKQCLAEQKRLFLATDVLSSLGTRKFPSRADLIDLGVAFEIGCTDVIIPYGFKAKSEFINYIEYFFGKCEKKK